MTRIQALRALVLSNARACKFLSSRNDSDEELKDALNMDGWLFSALRAAHLTDAEITRLIAPMITLEGFTGATLNDVATCNMQSTYG